MLRQPLDTPEKRRARGPARARRALLLALGLLLAACASRSAAGGRNPNVISGAELEELRSSGVADLYELISRARPRWLQVRTERSLQLETVILVYHREVRLGGLEALRGYPLTAVTSLRYLDAAQAGLLPGAGSAHVEGAIVITTSGG